MFGCEPVHSWEPPPAPPKTEAKPVATTENMILSEISLSGIEDIEMQFNTLHNWRLSQLLHRNETLEIAKLHGIVLPRKYLREPQIIELIQDARNKPAERISCDCAGVGLRWTKADNYTPVDVFLDPSLDAAFPRAREILRDRMKYLSSVTERLELREVTNRLECDILIDSLPADSDGERGTLGWTRFYRVSGSEDLDVFGNSRASVKISMDPAEAWTNGFFATTSLHELEHGVGVGHINIRGNIIFPQFVEILYHFGKEELAAIQKLYGIPRIATA